MSDWFLLLLKRITLFCFLFLPHTYKSKRKSQFYLLMSLGGLILPSITPHHKHMIPFTQILLKKSPSARENKKNSQKECFNPFALKNRVGYINYLLLIKTQLITSICIIKKCLPFLLIPFLFRSYWNFPISRNFAKVLT